MSPVERKAILELEAGMSAMARSGTHRSGSPFARLRPEFIADASHNLVVAQVLLQSNGPEILDGNGMASLV
jgi:hypothetical protein